MILLFGRGRPRYPWPWPPFPPGTLVVIDAAVAVLLAAHEGRAVLTAEDTALVRLKKEKGMASKLNIRDFCRGDTLPVVRQIENVPSGETLTKAYLTIKEGYGAPDPGLIQKMITPVASASGHITDAGADRSGAVRFLLQPGDTALLVAHVPYVYDIQVHTSGGGVYTACVGTIVADPSVTDAVS